MGSIFELDEFKPFKRGFEDKQKTLDIRQSYYDGSIYRKWDKKLGWLGPRLGKDVKPLFLPLARAVDIDAGIIPGGWLFEGEGIEEGDQGLIDARDALFKASRWDIWGILFVHYGAQYGVSALKMVSRDDRVSISPIDPINLFLIYNNPVQLRPVMSLYVEKVKDADGKDIEKAEVITPEAFRFFLDGKEIDAPEGMAEANPFKMVPYIEVRHIETGDQWGECTFQKAMTLLDEVNSLAGKLAKVVEDHGDPQWAVFGAQPSNLTHSGDKVWFFPENAKAEIMVPEIDIEGTLAFIQEIKEGVKEALPELSFDELRSKDQIAAETLGLQLIELVLKVQRARPNYDAGLIEIMQMCGEVSPEYKALADEDIRFDQERPILPLDPMTKIRIEQAQITLEMMKDGPEQSSE